MPNAKYSYFDKESCGKTFHPEWSWQKQETDHPYKAMYLVCQNSFHLSGMGIQALKSHKKFFENQVDTP